MGSGDLDDVQNRPSMRPHIGLRERMGAKAVHGSLSAWEFRPTRIETTHVSVVDTMLRPMSCIANCMMRYAQGIHVFGGVEASISKYLSMMMAARSVGPTIITT